MSDLYTSVVDSLAAAQSTGRYVQKRIGEIIALDVHAARRIPDELEALVLEVRTEALRGIQKWPSSRGFDLQVEPLKSGPAGMASIYLQLLDTRFRDVFRALCRNACEVMQGASDEGDAVRLFHQRLVHWQAFLKKHGPEGLTTEERRGLFGELLILRDLLLPIIEAETVVQGWRGCKRAPQDFQLLGWALEVKTTRAVIPDRISVSNVEQLDGEGKECMFLTVVHVDENETAGETLPGIIESVRTALPEIARDPFDSGLAEVGYSDAHRELYATTHYLCREILHFDVTEGFPRLTRDQMPEGVKRVRYELTIDACRPFQVGQDTVVQRCGREGR